MVARYSRHKRHSSPCHTWTSSGEEPPTITRLRVETLWLRPNLITLLFLSFTLPLSSLSNSNLFTTGWFDVAGLILAFKDRVFPCQFLKILVSVRKHFFLFHHVLSMTSSIEKLVNYVTTWHINNIEGFETSIITAPQSVCYASKMPQVDMLLGRSKIDTGKSSSMFMPILSLLSDWALVLWARGTIIIAKSTWKKGFSQLTFFYPALLTRNHERPCYNSSGMNN